MILPDLDLLSDSDRPRLALSWNDDTAGERSPKKALGDHGDFSDLGETERACLFFVTTGGGEVFKRGRAVGVGGGGRGAMNLSAGFMVLTSPFAIELIEALRNRSGWISTGTERRLTGWPGRYGQDVVDGSEGS